VRSRSEVGLGRTLDETPRQAPKVHSDELDANKMAAALTLRRREAVSLSIKPIRVEKL
jgi:hypothetical protein